MEKNMDFWQTHGWVFLLGLTFFPRITTLFFTTASFGVLHVLGWFFAPHLLVAFMASARYWDTNPGLVIMAWLVAIGGTSGESKVVTSTR